MDYAELPLEERMNKAREYALLLAEEEPPVRDIPGRLRQTFKLTPAQAEEAYRDMKQEFRSAYFSARSARIWKAIAAALMMGCVMLFGGFLSGHITAVVVIMALFFGLAALGVASRFVTLSDERWLNNAISRAFFRKNAAGKSETHFTGGLLLIFFLLLVTSGCMLLAKANVYEPDELALVDGLQLSGAPEKMVVKGKHSHEYALLPQHQYRARFRFKDKYYRWGDPFMLFNQGRGVVVDLQVERKDIYRLQEEDAWIEVINLSIDGKPFYNLAARNKAKQDENRKMFFYSFLASWVTTVICFFRLQRYRRNPDLKW